MGTVQANSNSEIVGFDFGHGESAIAVMMADSTAEPKILEVGGARSFITAVAEHSTKGVLIGEEAYTIRDATKLRIGFKSPNVDRADVRAAIKAFIGRVFEMLIAEKKLRDDATALIVVGCPSCWNPATRCRYEELLCSIGWLKNVRLTAESRAAFLSAREDGLLGLDRNVLLGSALIIDVGSSTTDFTAVLRLKEQYIDFGDNRLGASLIEQTIFNRMLRRHARRADCEALFQRDPSWRARCELRCRTTKEIYFRRERGCSLRDRDTG